MKLTIIILLIVVGGMLVYIDILRRRINSVKELTFLNANVLIGIGKKLNNLESEEK